MSKGVVFNIQKFSIHDGPGIRTTVFLKGCPLRCKWCANPESQRMETEYLYDVKKCVGCGYCVAACPQKALSFDAHAGRIHKDQDRCIHCGKCTKACLYGAWKAEGRESAVDEIVNACLEDQPFYEESGGGVTISGGEGMMQPEFLGELLDALKEKGIHTAIETTGVVSPEIFQRLAAKLDLLLFDLKHPDDSMHRKGTGVSNSQILENLRWACQNNHEILCRIPVIPGFNDSREDALGFAKILKENGLDRVQLLCFHQMGERKYEMLERDYAYKDTQALRKEDLSDYIQVFKEEGIDAFV
ncbi:glycyl-radical enzyme activating protein [Allobaculum sp. JKK-2023]|uniref:glycyl-radical enzyme activating protein n=1 Tax=Allobaculum sp. JKK-2023 TaxID=3108943 RepID=UPI002B057E38|nr:glycyl-radical enzyme activating protein [Allobaculum sp. JKK-2023]